MWPWNRSRKALEGLSELDERLRKVEKSQEDFSTTVKKVRLEWEDVYDRLERIVGRINARARTERRATEDGAGEERQPSLDEINEAIRHGTYPVVQRRRG